MVRTVAAKARKAIVKAVQRSAQGIRTVAGDAAGAAALSVNILVARENRPQPGLDAAGAAAQAAAGVVLDSTANALEAGRTEVTQSAPAVKRRLGRAAKRTIGGRNRASSARKRSTKATRARISRRKNAPRRKTKRRSR